MIPKFPLRFVHKLQETYFLLPRVCESKLRINISGQNIWYLFGVLFRF